ncbi:uncharacterized protein [Littorina saxatilis]|uniref:uncharacterized protein n=1 Tax=Littorina saxatilis TaxID=31220 RepID=UPI0038B546B4
MSESTGTEVDADVSTASSGSPTRVYPLSDVSLSGTPPARGTPPTRGRGRTIRPRGRRGATLTVTTTREASDGGRGRQPDGSGRQRGGRGRQRIRRGSRGQLAVTSALTVIRDRRSRMRTMIETVSEQRLRELFVTMLEKYPSLVFDVLEPAPDRPDHGHPPPAGEGVPDWCICGKCRIMRKTIEEVCCRKATCLTLLAVSQLYDFEVLILDEAVLSLARKYRQDMIRADDEADDNNRANRHAAYRQFIFEQYKAKNGG